MLKGEDYMVSWTCPHCAKSMHSSWDCRDKEKVQCIHCDCWLVNPYFKEEKGAGGDGKA